MTTLPSNTPTTMKNTIETLDCGHAESEHSEITRGYAVLPDGRKICYDCATKRQIEDLKDRSKPFCAYVSLVSKDSWLGYKITTWTGGELMRVMSAKPCKLTRQSFTHDRGNFMSIHAVDVHGGHWAGRGSEGIVIKLRPVKS